MDATSSHKLLSFMDGFLEYNQIHMASKDEEEMLFIIKKCLYYYKIPFGLKNVGTSYQHLVNKVFKD